MRASFGWLAVLACATSDVVPVLERSAASAFLPAQELAIIALYIAAMDRQGILGWVARRLWHVAVIYVC